MVDPNLSKEKPIYSSEQDGYNDTNNSADETEVNGRKIFFSLSFLFKPNFI